MPNNLLMTQEEVVHDVKAVILEAHDTSRGCSWHPDRHTWSSSHKQRLLMTLRQSCGSTLCLCYEKNVTTWQKHCISLTVHTSNYKNNNMKDHTEKLKKINRSHIKTTDAHDRLIVNGCYCSFPLVFCSCLFHLGEKWGVFNKQEKLMLYWSTLQISLNGCCLIYLNVHI